MTVRVLFFAYLRDVTGTAETSVDLPEGAKVRDVWQAVNARWPNLETQLVRIPVVVDGKVVDLETTVPDGAEVVWLPPVGGGAGAGRVVRADLVETPLDLARLVSEVTAPNCGGIVTFLGVVRGQDGAVAVKALTYAAYESLARTQFRAVADEALERWPDARIALEHRTGRIVVGDASVAIAVACPHRAEAFECCRYLIDRLKSAVPIWKREEGEAGERWIEGHAYEPDDPKG